MAKRFFALLLTCFMMFSMFSFPIFAEEDEPTLEEEQEKEDEKNNDGSDIKDFSNLNNQYFSSMDNLALYCDVKAIGYDINQNGGSDLRFPKEAIVDGDTATKFGTYKSAKTGYVTLRFHQKQKLNKIVLSESSLSLREYTISYSVDGVNWTKLLDVEGMNGIKDDVRYYFDKSAEKELSWQDIMDVENTINSLYSIHYFEPIEAKYLKFDMTRLANQQSNTAWGFYINEIGAFYEETVNYDRYNLAYKKAKSYLEIVSKQMGSYDKDKISKLAAVLEQTKDLKQKNLSQAEVEKISDRLVEARISVYRSRIYKEEDFDIIADNVASQLNVNREYTEEADIAKRTADINGGINASKNMIKGGTSLLWTDIGTFENARYTQTPVKVQDVYRRIRAMALAATAKFSPVRGDQTILENISYALKIADMYWYSPEIPWFDSSMWSQMLGTPPIYSDILVILKGYLPDEELVYYAQRLSKEMKNDYMNWNGVNRMNIALANAKVGVVLKEYWRIDNLRQSVEQESTFVDEAGANGNFYVGNGYYSDGTFIYHNNTPYNGGYGQDGLAYNVNSIVALGGSPWELPNEKLIKYFIDIINKGYDPIVVDGSMMSMMQGRNIARGGMENKKACELANTISVVLPLIEEPYQTQLKSMIKSWFSGRDDWKTKVNSDVLELMRDESIPVRDEIYLNKMYNYADRAVHRRGDWSLGVSMSSSRIKMYEGINNENKKGWYTGSGATYLYNEDKTQFDDDFWFTVDMNRLPGITVEKAPRLTTRYQGESVTPYDCVGGVSLNDLYGSAQMELYQWESDLTARKSWFMFDDEVVCIGSNINCLGDNKVETVIENRMIDENSKISVDGKEITQNKITANNSRTTHILGRNKAQIGYYYPQAVNLQVLKDTRTHKLSEITETPPKRNDPFATRTYATVYLDHGKFPQSAKYGYVVLPGKSVEETEKYAKNPNIKILADEADYHAVKEEMLGITAINLFEDKEIEVDGIKVDKKSALMVSQKDNILELSISDITKKNDGYIHVMIGIKGSEVISKSETIQVVELDSGISLKINVKDTKGANQTIKIALK